MPAAPAYADILAAVPTETCRTCKATTGPCVSISGASKGKPLAGGAFHPVRLADAAWHLGYTSRDAEVKGLTDSLQLTGVQYKAAQGTIADLRAQIAELQEQLNPPPVVVVEPKHPVLATDIRIHPSGSDGNPGTDAAPRATPKGNVRNVLLPGTYANAAWKTPAGAKTTLVVADGTTAVLDGKATTKIALTASGLLDLLGDGRVQSYAPPASTGISCAALYFGGKDGGSQIDGWSVASPSQAALAFQVPMVLTKLTVTDCGYSGILGTTADGTVFGDVQVLRVNRGNHAMDGQLAGIKMTRSKDLHFDHVYVEAANGANGLWTDVSCRNPTFAGCQVVSNGAPAYIGLQVEESEGGTVVGCTVEGKYAGSLTASGHLAVWENTFTGTVLGLQVRQDRPKNTGKTPANLSPTLAPWWAVGNVVSNNVLTGPVAFACYSDAAYGLAATDMLDLLAGNTYGGTVSLGRDDGSRQTVSAAQMTQILGTRFSSTKAPVPDDVAALLA